jgi:putative flippase GtrA
MVDLVVTRWIVFNAVGAIGVVVQLGALAALVHGSGMHYPAATAVAVEMTLLHNFAWHQRWTWRDRPAASHRSLIDRLIRFHLLNGSISIAGNLAVMAALTGGLGVDPVLANGAAIMVCSLINFAAGDRLVFRTLAVRPAGAQGKSLSAASRMRPIIAPKPAPQAAPTSAPPPLPRDAQPLFAHRRAP